MYVNWQQTEQIQNDHRISDSIIMTRKRDYPNISWAAIAQEVKNNGINMTSKKCRDRYELYLNPISQIKPEWTKEDDDLLDKLYGKLGAKWALIAKSFSGRSSHEIKNHWAKKKRDSFAKPDVSNEEDEDYDEDEDDQNYDPFKKQQKAIDYIKNYPSRICIVDDYGKDKGGNDIKKVPIVMQGTRTKDIQEYKKMEG